MLGSRADELIGVEVGVGVVEGRDWCGAGELVLTVAMGGVDGASCGTVEVELDV